MTEFSKVKFELQSVYVRMCVYMYGTFKCVVIAAVAENPNFLCGGISKLVTTNSDFLHC